MKAPNENLPYSLVNRRTFLTRVGAVLGGGFAAQLLLPLWRYVFPGRSREPDKVGFSDDLLAQLNALAPGACLRFAWGGFPGLILQGGVSIFGTRRTGRGSGDDRRCRSLSRGHQTT